MYVISHTNLDTQMPYGYRGLGLVVLIEFHYLSLHVYITHWCIPELLAYFVLTE